VSDEIVTMKFSRAGKTDASGSWWSGFFLYPIDPVIETQQNVVVAPSPAGQLPAEAVAYAMFSADEIAAFNAGTLLWVSLAVKLTAEEDATRATRIAALRAAYSETDQDQRTRLQAKRREYRSFGARMDA
jgi:hypothetical protein